ncbi:LysR family transcriptional regulator [Pediococcus damnosus]|uniref:LysR family transcriptional regulator n=1 Tax=Pediococcus damnosus TaxID=51663 RepID=UPI00078E766C|nr:LysR family transcriptional regulator [Pediococcus damnosus]AMV60460.1 LysR family transcriptional regulator [Pediococcus damnosus]AMV64711.1 LysR family transcriptional regulator [Pediococcus damnosus]
MANFSYEIFAQVVTTKNFGQAAKILNVTPSAVSHAISQLENELGFPLFIRNRTGVEITPDGQQILPVVQNILNSEAQLQQVADQIRGLNLGTVRIGAFSSVCINWLPSIIQHFKKKYPGVDVSITQGTFSEIAEMARIGTVDIGFATLPVDSQLNTEPLVADPIYCVTPADFVPKNKTYITTDDIGDYHFILQQIDYDRDTKKTLDQYNVVLNAISYSIDDQSILSMVESGLGFGILPKLALQKLTGDVNVYPFSHQYYRTICLSANKTQAEAPSTKLMLAEIHAYLADRYHDDYLGKPVK